MILSDLIFHVFASLFRKLSTPSSFNVRLLMEVLRLSFSSMVNVICCAIWVPCLLKSPCSFMLEVLVHLDLGTSRRPARRDIVLLRPAYLRRTTEREHKLCCVCVQRTADAMI